MKLQSENVASGIRLVRSGIGAVDVSGAMMQKYKRRGAGRGAVLKVPNTSKSIVVCPTCCTHRVCCRPFETQTLGSFNICSGVTPRAGRRGQDCFGMRTSGFSQT